MLSNWQPFPQMHRSVSIALAKRWRKPKHRKLATFMFGSGARADEGEELKSNMQTGIKLSPGPALLPSYDREPCHAFRSARSLI